MAWAGGSWSGRRALVAAGASVAVVGWWEVVIVWVLGALVGAGMTWVVARSLQAGVQTARDAQDRRVVAALTLVHAELGALRREAELGEVRVGARLEGLEHRLGGERMR